MASYIQTKLLTAEGRNLEYTFIKEAITCPYCQTSMIPDLLYGSVSIKSGMNIFCRCTNHNCERTFIGTFGAKEHFQNGQDAYAFARVKQDMNLRKEQFSEVITNISPNFVNIYNQAYAAQQVNLNEICGVGYRKALEFLLKDYVMSSLTGEEAKEKIKRKQLATCIQEDISAINIKEVAKRAVWLGNDETHYVRKWEDKDIHNLIETIKLTIHWIETEEATKRILKEMAEPK